jgi:hypothetical protein
MRLIAFITEGTQIRRILEHIGVDSEPPHISPARGPPLWEDCDTQTDDGVHIEPDWATDWDGAAQPAPDFEVDQRTANPFCEQRILVVDRPGTALLRARCGFLRGLRAFPTSDTWPHVVEMLIRYPLIRGCQSYPHLRLTRRRTLISPRIRCRM